MKKKIEKTKGQIISPRWLVEFMYKLIASKLKLDLHLMDNSCGDGAFLCVYAEVLCTAHERLYPGQKERLKECLETYIHGIEIDTALYERCLTNLSQTASKFGIEDVKWDVQNGDALTTNDYNGQMDIVIGNPPYVRIHNMTTSVRNFIFCKEGMSDMYLAFFEKGLEMLKENGTLLYITPNSWLTSASAKELRKFVVNNHLLRAIYDFEGYQVFPKVSSYTIINKFEKSEMESFVYCKYFDAEQKTFDKIEVIQYSESYINGKLYTENLEYTKDILSCQGKTIQVKNGYATLNDDFFINDDIPNTPFTIKVIKASTGMWKNCFYPYDKSGKPLDEDILMLSEPMMKYFEKHENIRKKMVYFGRTQALKDTYTKKLAVNNLIRDKKDLKVTKVKAGQGVYSGFYILADDVDDKWIKKTIISDEFVAFVKSLKKYKSGGYYTFNTKDLEKYLNFKYESL